MLFPLPEQSWPPLAPLWANAEAGRFALPRCTQCGRFDWYPQGVCRACGSEQIVWQTLSGRGTLFSWAVVSRALHPPLAGLGVHIPAIVSIEEAPLTRFVTRMIDTDPHILRVDMPVKVQFKDAGYPATATGMLVPLFTTATA